MKPEWLIYLHKVNQLLILLTLPYHKRDRLYIEGQGMDGIYAKNVLLRRDIMPTKLSELPYSNAERMKN